MRPVRTSDVAAIEYEPGLFARKLIDGSTGSAHIALVRGWLEPGASHAPHTHDVEEAVVFLSGRGVLMMDGRHHDVETGDAICIPPHVVHSTINPHSETLHFVAAFADNTIRARPAGEDKASSLTRQPARVLNQLRWLTRRALGR